jgi:excisionase family DNA binding protein
MDQMADDAPLDLADAARRLGVHYQTAYRWVREGELRAVKVGKRYRVQRRDVEGLARRRQRARHHVS